MPTLRAECAVKYFQTRALCENVLPQMFLAPIFSLEGLFKF